MPKKKNRSILSKIHTREDARAMVKSASIGLASLALYYLGLFSIRFLENGPQEFRSRVFFSLIFFIICSWLLQKYRSRLVAILVLFLSTYTFLFIVILAKENLSALNQSDVLTIIVDFVTLGIGIRATEATFKLHGRFATEA